MSEVTETVETETVEQDAPIVEDSPKEESPKPKPSETLDWWRDKSRHWEKLAKENSKAREELDALREESAKAQEELEAFRQAQLTAEEREAQQREKEAQERAEAIRERDAARQEALRWRIAAKHGISDEDAELFLTGSDEEALTRQAERFTALAPKPGKGNIIPGAGNQPKEQPSIPTLAEQIRTAEQAGDKDLVAKLKAQQLFDLAQNPS